MRLILVALALTIIVNANIINEIKHHEGFSRHMYNDNGHTSIGYGLNLTNGLSKAEAELLLIHRVAIIKEKLLKYRWYRKLNKPRKQVIINMSYNLGIEGVLSFKHMIWRLNHNLYKSAANAMVDSLWYRQVGNRGKFLVNKMIKGN